MRFIVVVRIDCKKSLIFKDSCRRSNDLLQNYLGSILGILKIGLHHFFIHASFWNANLVEIVFNHAWIEFKWFKMIFYEFFSSWWWISSFVVFKSLSHLKNPCPRWWRHNRWKRTFYLVCQDNPYDHLIGQQARWSYWSEKTNEDDLVAIYPLAMEA